LPDQADPPVEIRLFPTVKHLFQYYAKSCPPVNA
jgi:hypothetical protein